MSLTFISKHFTPVAFVLPSAMWVNLKEWDILPSLVILAKGFARKTEVMLPLFQTMKYICSECLMSVHGSLKWVEILAKEA